MNPDKPIQAEVSTEKSPDGETYIRLTQGNYSYGGINIPTKQFKDVARQIAEYAGLQAFVDASKSTKSKITAVEEDDEFLYEDDDERHGLDYDTASRACRDKLYLAIEHCLDDVKLLSIGELEQLANIFHKLEISYPF